jgi:hypothetical protein
VHLELAVRHAPDYLPPYFHLTWLFLSMKKWKWLSRHVWWLVTHAGVDEAILFECLGAYNDTGPGAEAFVAAVRVPQLPLCGTRTRETEVIQGRARR